MPAMNDLLNLAELFIEHGAGVNERLPESNQIALSQAVNEGHTEYVEFLLKHGATVYTDDRPETNPVAIAKKHGFKTILSLLEDGAHDDEVE